MRHKIHFTVLWSVLTLNIVLQQKSSDITDLSLAPKREGSRFYYNRNGHGTLMARERGEPHLTEFAIPPRVEPTRGGHIKRVRVLGQLTQQQQPVKYQQFRLFSEPHYQQQQPQYQARTQQQQQNPSYQLPQLLEPPNVQKPYNTRPASGQGPVGNYATPNTGQYSNAPQPVQYARPSPQKYAQPPPPPPAYITPPPTTTQRPQCYQEQTGFICCNNKLENVIRNSMEKLNNDNPNFHHCNVQKIANTVQKAAEDEFSHPFEVVVGLSDFALKVHYHQNYLCKSKMLDRYVMAYGTPNWQNGGVF